VARELGISMELIKLKASSAITSPNNTTTGGSMGSEMNCFVSFYRIFFRFLPKVAFFFFILELPVLISVPFMNSTFVRGVTCWCIPAMDCSFVILCLSCSFLCYVNK
jgi:hypothetical protein